MTSILLALRFLSELALLAAAGAWGHAQGSGFATRWGAAIGAMAVVAFAWGRWVAPKSATRLTDPTRLAVEIVLFALGALALAAAHHPVRGVALGVAGTALALAMRRAPEARGR